MQEESPDHNYVSPKDIKRRHVFSLLGVVVSTVIYLAYYIFVLPTHDLMLILGVLGIFLVSYSLLLYLAWSGMSRCLADPSLVMPLMMWAILKWSVLAYITPELRHIIILGVLNIMCFAVFVLKWRGYVSISLFMITCFSTVFFALYLTNATVMDPVLDIIAGLTFCLSLSIHCLVGREFSLLRSAFRQRNRDLQRAMARIEELAVTDELTGLFNRRYLLQELEKHQALFNRNHLPFTLAFLDIDHFKAVNDEFGHHIGDQVLAKLAQFLQTCIRDEDIVVRYGGEEFVIIFAGLTVHDASIVLERIRMAVEQTQFVECVELLTVSIGATEYLAGESSSDLLDRADELLYTAKNNGRNRVSLKR